MLCGCKKQDQYNEGADFDISSSSDEDRRTMFNNQFKSDICTSRTGARKSCVTGSGPCTRSQLSYTWPVLNSDLNSPHLENGKSKTSSPFSKEKFVDCRRVLSIEPLMASCTLEYCRKNTRLNSLDADGRKRAFHQTEEMKDLDLSYACRPKNLRNLHSLLNMDISHPYHIDYDMYKKLTSGRELSKSATIEKGPLKSILSRKDTSSSRPSLALNHEFQKPKVRFAANVLLFSYNRDT